MGNVPKHIVDVPAKLRPSMFWDWNDEPRSVWMWYLGRHRIWDSIDDEVSLIGRLTTYWAALQYITFR